MSLQVSALALLTLFTFCPVECPEPLTESLDDWCTSAPCGWSAEGAAQASTYHAASSGVRLFEGSSLTYDGEVYVESGDAELVVTYACTGADLEVHTASRETASTGDAGAGALPLESTTLLPETVASDAQGNAAFRRATISLAAPGEGAVWAWSLDLSFGVLGSGSCVVDEVWVRGTYCYY